MFCECGDLLNVAVEHGVAKKGGAWYNYKDLKLGQGFEASKKFLKDNPKIAQEMAKEVKDAIKEETEEDVADDVPADSPADATASE